MLTAPGLRRTFQIVEMASYNKVLFNDEQRLDLIGCILLLSFFVLSRAALLASFAGRTRHVAAAAAANGSSAGGLRVWIWGIASGGTLLE